MLIKPDSKSELIKGASSPTMTPEPIPEVPPPSYTSTIQSPSSTPSKPMKPSNLVSIIETNNCVRGSFLIDPSLQIPTSWLPPLAEDESSDKDRQNLKLQSKNGSIQAEVFVLSREFFDSHERRKVTLTTKTVNGSIVCKVHRDESNPRFILKASSQNGSVVVHIPRSFRGLITTTTRCGQSRLSASLMAQSTRLGNVGNVGRYYVGDYNPDDVENDLGDELIMGSQNGSLKVLYDDEEEPNIFSFLIKSARQFLS